MVTNIDEILNLPNEEKIELMERIRESLDDNNTAPVLAWHMQILNERLEDYKLNPTEGKSWEEVRQSILGR